MVESHRHWSKRAERGHGEVGYLVITLLLSVVVIRPELVAAVFYQLGDLFSLFVSQLDAIF